MASKKQQEAFNKKVEKLVLSLGGSTNTENSYKWVIPTKASKMFITVQDPEPSELFSIFCRFDDPKLSNEMLKEKTRLNSFSGKFNYHDQDPNYCLAALEKDIIEIETHDGLYVNPFCIDNY